MTLGEVVPPLVSVLSAGSEPDPHSQEMLDAHLCCSAAASDWEQPSRCAGTASWLDELSRCLAASALLVMQLAESPLRAGECSFFL